MDFANTAYLIHKPLHITLVCSHPLGAQVLCCHHPSRKKWRSCSISKFMLKTKWMIKIQLLSFRLSSSKLLMSGLTLEMFKVEHTLLPSTQPWFLKIRLVGNINPSCGTLVNRMGGRTTSQGPTHLWTAAMVETSLQLMIQLWEQHNQGCTSWKNCWDCARPKTAATTASNRIGAVQL